MTHGPNGVDSSGTPGEVWGGERRAFRYGYKVVGCEPRLVGESLDEVEATIDAQQSADAIRQKLVALGGPSEVEYWVQPYTAHITTEYQAPQGGLI